jgi:hypothetical protein
MNFFGHAALAADHFAGAEPALLADELARVCAGAMLPDFLGMLRLSRPNVRDGSVARGVAFHHRTDEVFHELAAFQRLSRDAFAWLSEHGLPRGPARAVAHIGIEILLDEVLARDAAARTAYLSALEAPLPALLDFAKTEEAERLAALQRTLLARAALPSTPAAELVAERIARSLSGRPRLAVDARGQQLLGGWVVRARPRVDAEAPEVLAMLRARLASFGRAE